MDTGWDLGEALTVIKTIQPWLHENSWHVTLGGGVLNNGRSDKDLDLYFLPFSSVTTMPSSKVRSFLVAMWGAPALIAELEGKYPPTPSYSDRLKFHTPDGKRIDVFIGRNS